MKTKMSLNALVVAGLMGASSLAVAGNSSLDLMYSNVTQKIEIGNLKAEEDQGGAAIQWRSQSQWLPFIGVVGSLNFAPKEGNVAMVGLMPNYDVTDRFNVYGKIGASWSNATGADDIHWGAWGVGAAYYFTERFGLVAEYNSLYDEKPYTMTSVDIGLSLRF